MSYRPGRWVVHSTLLRSPATCSHPFQGEKGHSGNEQTLTDPSSGCRHAKHRLQSLLVTPLHPTGASSDSGSTHLLNLLEFQGSSVPSLSLLWFYNNGDTGEDFLGADHKTLLAQSFIKTWGGHLFWQGLGRGLRMPCHTCLRPVPVLQG